MRSTHQISGFAACFLLAPVLASAAWASPKSVVQSYDTYKSWLAACDNTLVCVAKGVSQSDTPVDVKITRQPGGDGGILMEIRASARFTLGDIRIDDKPAKLAKPAWRVSSDGDTTSVTSRDFTAIKALFSQLRNAQMLMIGDGAQVQLDGLAAAMLRLDDRQGRVGGVTSLARTGPLPASQVAPGPAIPKISTRPITATLAPAEAQRLVRQTLATQKDTFAKQDCQAKITVLQGEAFALDNHRALVLIPCGLGSYQVSSLAFIADRNGAGISRLTAPAPFLGHDPHESVVEEFTESDFDRKTGTLSMAAKGRGMADCGFSASWIWNGESMVLVSMAYQDACGGVEPGDWPTLFRSVQ